MLKFPKKIMALFLSLLLLIPGAAVTAFAEYDTGNGNVVQSGDGWKLYENGLLYVSDADRIILNQLNDFDLVTKLYLTDNIDFDNLEFYYDGSSFGVTDQEVEFYKFENLESIEVSETNPNYTSADGVLYNKDITTVVTYPPGKTDETYIIPNSITSIYIFDLITTNIKNIIIPDSVINIYGLPYVWGRNEWFLKYGSSKLENISVSENNPNYSSIDGVLFNKEQTELVYYPYNHNVSSYAIPSGVKEFGVSSFANTGITDTVIIPSTVEDIQSFAFPYSRNLKTVIFEDGPRNLTIEYYAFYGCTNLDNIQLNGERIYKIDARAFKDCKIMNESNYEDGVLYLNDILLFVDNSKIPLDYTVKDGTKVIADNSWIVHSDNGEYIDPFEFKSSDEEGLQWSVVNVTIPDSVDNIGTLSILNYESIPENMFRVGSTFYFDIESDDKNFEELTENMKMVKDYNEILDEYSSYFNTSNIEEIKEACKNNYNWISFDVDNWVLKSNVMHSYLTAGAAPHLYKVKDGTVGFADLDNQGYADPSVYVSCFNLGGIILPESFKHLSKDTFVSHVGVYSYFFYIIGASSDDEFEYLSNKSITINNKDCYIYDSPQTIPPAFTTICGYKGSTAEAYAIKYDRNFVDISECQHEKTCPSFTIEPTCGKDGYSGDVYCQYCGEYIKEGEVIPATGEHEFSSPERIKDPTCTEPGEEKVKCSQCGYTETRKIEPNGHDFIIRISSFDGTCTEDGYVVRMCIFCNETQKEITSIATGHIDEDSDGYCDKCGEKLKTDCSCICHKDNAFSRFFYKLFRILWKIFRINKSCDCGAAHY